MREISWRELLGNPYRYGLMPQMLLPSGCKYPAKTQIRGQSRADDKVSALVHFDEDYVYQYLEKLVLEKLQPASFGDFQRIMRKAWQRWENQQ